jgi:hypothetical protein
MGHTITIVLALAGAAAQCPVQAGETLRVEVRETAGVQRFSYPLEASFNLPHGPADAKHFRLRNGDQPIAAQFSLLEANQSDKSSLWTVDFNIDLSPGETRELALDYGDDIDPGPSAPRGLTTEREGGKTRVRHPTLEFVVPDDLQGLLSAVRIGEEDCLVGGSRGLVLRFKDGREIPLVGSAHSGKNPLRVLKSGPLAVALEFTGKDKAADGQPVTSRVRLDFPLGKSWLRIAWTLDDPSDAVAAVSAELRLRLDRSGSQPILADFGANGWTYAALKPDEQIVYRAGDVDGAGLRSVVSSWTIERILAGRATLYSAPRTDGRDVPPQGWAHLTDERRSTAIAVDRFAQNARDTIALPATGQIQLRREFAAAGKSPRNGKRQFTFWCHFVKSPPQWGAATSPQSMQTPPEVRVLQPR